MAITASPATRLISIDQIVPNPDQPRKAIDQTSEAFLELRNSIWKHGLLQPVVVAEKSAHVYSLLAGERRWRVFRDFAQHDAKRFSNIPAIVRPAETDVEALILGLTENVVREDLRPGDRAAAVVRLRALTGATLEKVASQMGLSLSFVKKLAAIGESEPVMNAVNTGTIGADAGAAIAKATRGDNEAAVELIGAMERQPELPLAALVDSVKRLAKEEPAATRVAKAVASVEADFDEVLVLRSTPLLAVKPRVTTMKLVEYQAMIRKAAREMRSASAK